MICYSIPKFCGFVTSVGKGEFNIGASFYVACIKGIYECLNFENLSSMLVLVPAILIVEVHIESKLWQDLPTS